MPTRHRRSSYARGRRPSRYVWTNTHIADNAVASGTITQHDVLADLDVAGASKLGVTVMRIILQGTFAPFAVGDVCDFGFVVMPASITTDRKSTRLNSSHLVI